MVTGRFTAVPFGGTTTVVSLTETDSTMGGGEKLVLPPHPPPLPIKTRTSPAATTSILDRRK
jgi:hypothetical protein